MLTPLGGNGLHSDPRGHRPDVWDADTGLEPARSLRDMVLELLDGQPLSKILEGGRMSARRAVDLAIPVVRALARAHELSIIHRDLKPDNVFVTRSGQVQVLDFGVAKLCQGAKPPEARRPIAHDDPGELDPLQSKTADGAVVGTLPYVSPEQSGIDTVDHRADLWAMGVLLWQMLADEHPLGTTSPPALWAAVTDLDTPVRSLGAVRPDHPVDHSITS